MDDKDVRLAEVSVREVLIIGIYLAKMLTAEAEDLRAEQQSRIFILDAIRAADALLEAMRGHA